MTPEQRPRILAIDDTPANLQTLAAALARDYDLRIATSGAAGLTLAAASPPDLILLDVMMPEMDGYETCRRLRANPLLGNVPVIFVTALSDSAAEGAGLSLGAADYIAKPIDVAIARLRIGNLLERERLRKEVEAQRTHLEALVEARTLSLSIAKEAAETANRAKTIFLSTVSHELRTPINAIMGMTDLALRRASDPKQAEYLAKVKQASDKLIAVVSDILDISRLEAEQLSLDSSEFVLGAVLAQLTRLFADAARNKGLALTIAADPGLADMTLRGDPARLGQVLQCLVDNAIKFTAQGSVQLRAGLEQEGKGEVLLRFEVQDSGIGMSAEDQRHLFEPFAQADGSLTRSYGGAGLGLAIAKRLATLMGGTIGVDSAPGAGSRFWLTARFGREVPAEAQRC